MSRKAAANLFEGPPRPAIRQGRIQEHQGAWDSSQQLQRRSAGLSFIDNGLGKTGLQEYPQAVAQASGPGDNQDLGDIRRHGDTLSKAMSTRNAENFVINLVKNFVNFPEKEQEPPQWEGSCGLPGSDAGATMAYLRVSVASIGR